ncbi:hypothetical protein G6F56_000767 [Rhizopus delemar]|nr:hypothetical protein G6F56_000767 [Rhizopus delemar]
MALSNKTRQHTKKTNRKITHKKSSKRPLVTHKKQNTRYKGQLYRNSKLSHSSKTSTTYHHPSLLPTTTQLLSPSIPNYSTSTFISSIKNENKEYQSNNPPSNEVSIAAAASKFGADSGQDGIVTNNVSSTKPTQIIVIVLGFFGGIALIVVAMLLIVRKKNNKDNTERFPNDKSDKSEEDTMKCIPKLAAAPKIVHTAASRYYERESGYQNKNLPFIGPKSCNNSNNTMNELSSTADTLIDGVSSKQNTSKKENWDYGNNSQRSSWQTFVTCETAKTHKVQVNDTLCYKEVDTENQRKPIYKAQLANPLVAYS